MPPLNDTSRDWALVIGINEYPNLHGEDKPANLDGALGDMADFSKFLANSYLVHSDRIIPVQSPNPESPNADSRSLLDLARVKLIKTYNQLRENGANWQQRRIYVYMAGHGFIPASESNRALILAEARTPFIHHFIAQEAIDFFQMTKMFEEVLLFMDCCAIRNFNITPHRQDWLANAPQGLQSADPKVFKVYAASGDQPTREFRVKNSNKTRGLFTQLLLKALRGDEKGLVTTTSVYNVIESAQQNFAKHLEDVFDLDEDVRFSPFSPGDPHFDIFNFGAGPSVTIPMNLIDGVLLSNGDVVKALQNGVLVSEGVVANRVLELDLPERLLTLDVNGQTQIHVEVSNRTLIVHPA